MEMEGHDSSVTLRYPSDDGGFIDPPVVRNIPKDLEEENKWLLADNTRLRTELASLSWKQWEGPVDKEAYHLCMIPGRTYISRVRWWPKYDCWHVYYETFSNEELIEAKAMYCTVPPLPEINELPTNSLCDTCTYHERDDVGLFCKLKDRYIIGRHDPMPNDYHIYERLYYPCEKCCCDGGLK